MGKEKAAKMIGLTGAARSEFLIQRQLTRDWRSLSHKEWLKFCKNMADWFSTGAPTEFDDYVKANKERKLTSDIAALETIIKETGNGNKGRRPGELERLKRDLAAL